MTTEPTDAELKALWQLHAADIGGIFYYARAVLAKWGQPAQAVPAQAGEYPELPPLQVRYDGLGHTTTMGYGASQMRDYADATCAARKAALTTPAQPLHVAAINCPHEIDKDKIVLHFDSKQPGKNALAQLAARLQAAQAQEDARKPLTHEVLVQMHYEDEFGFFCDYDEFEQIARAIEAAHGITEPEAAGTPKEVVLMEFRFGPKNPEPDQPESMPLTQKEIIGMAREAGIEVHPRKDSIRIGSAILTGCDSTEEVTRFAALVAAKAAAKEREACTAACEKIKQQAEGIAKSRFMTDAGKDLHNAIAAPAQPVPAPGEPSEAPTQAQVDERSDTVWLFIRLGQKNIRRAITLLEIDSMRAPELAFGPLLLKAIAELRKT